MSRTATLILGLLAALGGSGCATLGPAGESLVPTKYQTRTGPYTVYTNLPIPPDAPAIRHLRDLERQMTGTLGLRLDPGAKPIEVYVLNDRKAFSHFLTFYFPELPPRRAFFLAQGDRRWVYTYMGERLEEDLRHEATHALLHATVADLPLWLDEGLAEYFETPEGRRGLNPEHVDRLPDDLAGGWEPDLSRLESLTDVRQMTPRDYREAWAWVHYLLNGSDTNRAALLGYLADLREGQDARPLSARLDDRRATPALLAHLKRVRDRPAAGTATADAEVRPVARFQDSPIELAAEPPRRRGVSGWLRGLFRGRSD